MYVEDNPKKPAADLRVQAETPVFPEWLSVIYHPETETSQILTKGAFLVDQLLLTRL